MTNVTVKDLDLICQNLTRRYLPDSQQFLVEKRASGYRFCLLNFDTTGLSDISPKPATKKELYYYLQMFEKGLEFRQREIEDLD